MAPTSPGNTCIGQLSKYTHCVLCLIAYVFLIFHRALTNSNPYACQKGFSVDAFLGVDLSTCVAKRTRDFTATFEALHLEEGDLVPQMVPMQKLLE